MTQPPSNPKIYYITRIDNLPKIAEAGCGWHTLKYEGRENRQSTFAMDTTPIAVASSLLTSLCLLPSPPWGRGAGGEGLQHWTCNEVSSSRRDKQ